MFTLRDRRTGELFDRWSDLGDKRRCLLERSWAGVFRNHLLVELPVDDLCRHLDERMGRPSKDLHVVIGVLLLQQLHDLSDAATVEALAFNMAWHYALDTRSEADSYFCEKTLRNYRRLFIEQGLDEMLFRRLTDRLVQAFSVDTSRQRMDSTALRSAKRRGRNRHRGRGPQSRSRGGGPARPRPWQVRGPEECRRSAAVPDRRSGFRTADRVARPNYRSRLCAVVPG